MSELGITEYFKTSAKIVMNTSYNMIVYAIDGFGENFFEGGFSPIMRRHNFEKIDAVRRAFKYESLIFHGWRSIWCTYVTVVAFRNFRRMKNEFAIKYGDIIPYHSHYDQKTSWDIMMLIGFFLIDLLIYSIRKKFMSRSVIAHHFIGILLGFIALISRYPHHYHANIFMCTEIVSCLTVLSHYAKESRSKLVYKIYLFQYLILTIFGRGWIWYTVLNDLIMMNASIACYTGFVPLVLMDVIWSRQCIKGLMK